MKLINRFLDALMKLVTGVDMATDIVADAPPTRSGHLVWDGTPKTRVAEPSRVLGRHDFAERCGCGAWVHVPFDDFLDVADLLGVALLEHALSDPDVHAPILDAYRRAA